MRPPEPTVVHLRRARDHADRHFREPLALDELASVALCSKYHLVRAFRATYGETPMAYLARRRIERAKELLRVTDHPVTRICHEVGFASVGTFGRRFRAMVGISPTAYRRLAREQAATGRIPACFAFMATRPVDPAIGEKAAR